MPSGFRRGIAALNAEANAVGRLLNGGVLRLYDGTQPESPDTQVTDQRVIAELRFGSPAFQPARRGMVTATPLEPDPAARTVGMPTWFRALTPDGTPVYDGSAGVASTQPDLVLDRAMIPREAKVSVSLVTYRAVPT